MALPPPLSTNAIGIPTQDMMNALNQAFYSRLSARNDILLTQTILNGIFCVRFVVGSERTTEDDVCRAVDIILEEAECVVRESRVKNEKMGRGMH